MHILYDDDEMDALYEKARRFDEGEICRSRQYSDIIRRRTDIFEKIVAMCGEHIIPLLDEYTELLYSEMELEAMHFFREGYLARKNEGVL